VLHYTLNTHAGRRWAVYYQLAALLPAAGSQPRLLLLLLLVLLQRRSIFSAGAVRCNRQGRFTMLNFVLLLWFVSGVPTFVRLCLGCWSFIVFCWEKKNN